MTPKHSILLGAINLILMNFSLGAQDSINYAGPLSQSSYFQQPIKYLENIDSSLFAGLPLLDKAVYSQLLLENNGTTKITSLSYTDFYKIYQRIKKGEYTPILFEFDSLMKYSQLMLEVDEINPIAIINFQTARISETAIANGDFSEEEHQLQNRKANSSSFIKDQIVGATIFKHNFFGDHVKFYLDSLLIQSNLPHLTIKQVDVDFDNGNGFVVVPFNQVFNVEYKGYSQYVELKIKLTYEDALTGITKQFMSVVSAWRKSPKDVSILFSGSNRRIDGSSYEGKLEEFFYPEKIKTITVQRICLERQGNTCSAITLVPVDAFKEQPYSLEVSLLYNPKNSSGKLRRPLIMCDGFDPGDKRNFWRTLKDDPMHELLPKERDDRGLFELLDGARGPWDETSEPQTNLVAALQEDGYDIIFVNFREGAGDIVQNAEQLRKFLNEVVNGSLRDNKTEEIILIGPSMGGVITRIALTKMEKAGEEHLVKSWISFDSPQKGANIPLALQYAVAFGSEFNPSPGAPHQENPMKAGKEKINSMAAKQLLRYHYTASNGEGKPAPEHEELQKLLDELGYPIYCKNFAITNGGKSALYNGRRQIIDFKATAWTYLEGYGHYNSDGTTVLFKGSRFGFNNDLIVNAFNQMALENSIGGRHSGLYTINYAEENEKRGDWGADDLSKFEQNTHGQKATFIPTCSAFGVEINRSNLFKPHTAFTVAGDETSGKIKTPFDEIYGMDQNEEHGKISSSTKDTVRFNYLRQDFINYHYPFIRQGKETKKRIAKNVAYVHYNSAFFGGKNRSFIFGKEADVNILTGEKVSFHPGTKIEKGAHVVIRTQQFPDYSTTLRIAKKNSPNKSKPWHNSEFSHKKYALEEERLIEIPSRSWELHAYPNPVKDILFLELTNLSIHETGKIKAYDFTGKMITEESVVHSPPFAIQTKNWEPGIYLIEITFGQITKKFKIVKR